MTMEIEEGNRLIVEFMNLGKQLTFMEHPKTGEYIPIDEAQFHSSFDWLMPVVEKIEKHHKANVCIWINQCSIEFYGVHDDPPKFDIKSDSKIESTWLAVIEFIKWYNANNL